MLILKQSPNYLCSIVDESIMCLINFIQIESSVAKNLNQALQNPPAAMHKYR